jgi:hypothetical protein
MERYIGTKLINAKPMTRAAYNEFRGWQLPADENGDDEGFLVEYLDGGKANTDLYAGYVSWSPAEVFDRAYRPCSAMTFGQAIEALKAGQKVARFGWNGKGMWVTRMDSGVCHNPKSDDEYTVREYIAMKTVDNQIVPWTASQTDMLSEDWMIIS